MTELVITRKDNILMRNTLIAGLSVAALTLAAGCSSDNAGGSQSEVADMLIEAFEADEFEGVEVDEGCIRDLADQLSDEDADAIVEAGPEGNPDVSDEADEIAEELFSCIEV